MMHQMFTPLLGRPHEGAVADEWESGTAASPSHRLHSQTDTLSRGLLPTTDYTLVSEGNPFEMREPVALRTMPVTVNDDGDDFDSVAHEGFLTAPSLMINDSESDCSSRHSFVDDHGSFGVVVRDQLYVGSYRDVCDMINIDVAGIKAYLCVAREIAMPPHIDANQIAKGDVAFLHLPLADNATTNLRDHFATIFNFIDEQAAHGRPVAIYCQQGKSRSVSFALAYLMYKSKLSLEDAFREMRLTYRRADPNVFFLAQLADWDLACARRRGARE